MTLRCLFVDFDSFFASVEQYDAPELRGRPVAVAAVAAETTACLAASRQAKQFGIKTGTPIAEARERCPDITIVLARPARYVEMHHRFLEVIESCIHHEHPSSIDEVACHLLGREREPAAAIAIARNIKQALRDAGLSPAITCSAGIAPNKFLAKTASDMNKPDGITVIEQRDLPDALHPLALRDLCGIGPSMERRLNDAGITTVRQLCAADRARLRGIWGSVEGERFWMQLRGFDLPERVTQRSSIGHSHVLGPELRNGAGMRSVLFKLLAKCAMRLRHENLQASAMHIAIRFVGQESRFERSVDFAALDDTPTLLRLLAAQLRPLERAQADGRWQAKRHPPLSVAVSLHGLHDPGQRTRSLLAGDARAQAISRVLDKVNRRYDNNTLYMGAMQRAIEKDAAPMRIPFQHVPDIALERDHRENIGALDLVQQRHNQVKVIAQDQHAKRQASRRTPPKPTSYGASGWAHASRDHREGRSGQADLFDEA